MAASNMTFHAGNIAGNPWSTAISAIVGIAQYMATQGAAMPDSPAAWVQFVAGAVLAVLGALMGTQPRPGDQPMGGAALRALPYVLALALAASTAWAVRPDAVSENPTGQSNVEVLQAANQNGLPTPAPNFQRWSGNNASGVTPPTPAADECVLADEITASSADAFTLRCKSGVHIDRVHLLAGTTAAGTAPLYFTAGPLLSSVEAGAMEYTNNSLYFTNLAVRRSIVQGQQVLTADETVANTATETTVFTQAHNANYLKVGKQEEIVLVGAITSISGAGNNTLTIRVKYAGSTQATFVVPEAARSGVGLEVHILLTVRAVGSGTTSIQIHGNADVYGTASDPVVNTLATGLDSTSAQATTVTVQWSDADAGNSVVFSQGRALSIDNNS